jgi:hypothetical protein
VAGCATSVLQKSSLKQQSSARNCRTITKRHDGSWKTGSLTSRYCYRRYSFFRIKLKFLVRTTLVVLLRHRFSALSFRSCYAGCLIPLVSVAATDRNAPVMSCEHVTCLQFAVYNLYVPISVSQCLLHLTIPPFIHYVAFSTSHVAYAKPPVLSQLFTSSCEFTMGLLTSGDRALGEFDP